MNAFKTLRTPLFLSLMTFALLTTSCNPESREIEKTITRDKVFNTSLYDVRLGDGVPLQIDVSVRWKIEDYDQFSEQFASPDHYDSLVLAPRQLELANIVANHFNNVDSVFTVERKTFVNELKSYFISNLGETGIAIKEVIVSDVKFPVNYTNAMEQLAMQEQELERIRKQSTIELERSQAAKAQAEENGKVTMAQAEIDAKVQRINAQTEKSIRENRLAQAETQKQVALLQTQAEAERMERMAEVELKKQKEMKALDIKQQQERDRLAIDKQKQEDQLAINKQKGMDELVMSQDQQIAKLCSDNPTYANYMVNKELASKVQIAVLPSTGDASVFSGLLNGSMQR